MSNRQTRAGDMTGRKREELAAEAAVELAKRQEEISIINQQEQDRIDNEIVEYPVTVVDEPLVEIRVNEDLESVTVGVGNHYDFKKGQRYKVPKNVADNLEERGYVWH